VLRFLLQGKTLAAEVLTLAGTSGTGCKKKFLNSFSAENSGCRSFGAGWHQWHWLEQKFLNSFSPENSPCGSFGAGRHQWHWLEEKFLNLVSAEKLSLRKFCRWPAPVALVGKKISEFFFPRKLSLRK